MFDFLGHLKKAWQSPRRWPAIIVLFAVALVSIVGYYFVTLRPAILTTSQSEMATSKALYLDCAPDFRVSVLRAQGGALPSRVIFLTKEAALDMTIGPIAQHDSDLDIYEIHNTFRRCELTNDGYVDLHNIRLSFEFHGYGAVQNRLSTYSYVVNVAHLAPSQTAEFAITSAQLEIFFVFPPSGATARSPLETEDQPVKLDLSLYTNTQMSHDMLMPTALRKTAWKPSPCMWEGEVSITAHHPVPPGGLIGTAVVHLPKACAGAPWINGPVNP